MKLWLMALVALIFFTACNSRIPSIAQQNRDAQLAIWAQQQRAQEEARRLSYAKPAKKKYKLRKVEDSNFDSNYMYPQTRSKPPKIIQAPRARAENNSSSNSQEKVISVPTGMSKSECINILGQEKYDKYTQMFGSEAASIKRCKMIKAMKN